MLRYKNVFLEKIGFEKDNLNYVLRLKSNDLCCAYTNLLL